MHMYFQLFRVTNLGDKRADNFCQLFIYQTCVLYFVLVVIDTIVNEKEAAKLKEGKCKKGAVRYQENASSLLVRS